VSALLSDDQFVTARQAVRAGTVSEDLYRWLGRVVALAQATRTVAPAPVPGGNWDDPDAVAETVQAWLEESLLRGALLQAFDTCETPRSLARYLDRALRNWLVARSRRRSMPRLLERAAEMLAEQPFTIVRDSSSVMDRWWGLAAWEEAQLYAGEDDTVAAAAWALGDFALLRYPSSERSDPVLSTPELRRFLWDLLERVAAALNGRHVDYSFRQRFAYAYAAPSVGLEDVPELADTSSPANHAEVAEAARIALASLTGRQTRVLLERPHTTLEELAGVIGVSRGTVDNEYRRSILKIREATPSEDTFDAVLEKVLLLASGGEQG
jgi:hypothetical protein